jgi:hypothetical protein
MADFSLNNLASNPNYDFRNVINNSDSTNKFVSNESPYSDVNIQCTYTNETDFIKSHNTAKMPFVLSLNIQSLMAKFNDFSSLIINLTNSKRAPTFICLQEIWQVPDSDFVTLPGYQPLIYKCRSNNVQGGGVGIYVLNNISFSINDLLSVFVDRVYKSIVIDTTLNGKKFTIGSIYRPGTHPSLSSNVQFNEFFEISSHIFEKCSNLKSSLALYGDINIDCLKYNLNNFAMEYVDLLFSYGLLQLVNRPTRCTVTSATLIDHIIVNQQFLSSKIFLLVSMISDHFPLIHFLSAHESNCKKSKSKIRDYSERNISNFNDALSAMSWNDVTQETDPQIALNNFYDTFNSFRIYVYLMFLNHLILISTKLNPG